MAGEFLADELTDITNSPAYGFLDALNADGSLTKAVVDMYKSQYAQLHEYVLQTYEREKTLLKKAKTAKQELIGENIRLEKQGIRIQEESEVLTNLEREKEKGMKELSDCEERDTMLHYNVTEMQCEQTELARKLEQMRQENAELVQPEIKQVTDAIAELKTDLVRVETAYETEKRRKSEFLERIDTVRAQSGELQETKIMERKQLNKMQSDPDRIRKQADVVAKAADNLQNETANTQEKIRECERQLSYQATKREEVDEVGKDLARKLELHRTTIEQRERDVEAVQKSLEYERGQHADIMARRMELELSKSGEESALKGVLESVSHGNKELEREKRKLKKKQQLLEAARNTLPQLNMQVTDLKHQLEAFRTENKRHKRTLRELKQEVDIFIANYLRQENLEKDKREALDAHIAHIRELEEQIVRWISEEHKQSKTQAVLTAQREIKAREASKAMQNERETKEDLKVKELIILDLTKKCNETNNRLKEFSALYDVVKNERNKYVNLIQASSQALAEMKEKIKILQNEVEILRNESIAKDKALANERLAHQSAQCQRDALRLDSNKSQALYRNKQRQVDQQIKEIDKLNSIINGMEKEMLRLKQRYELAVETRNFTGVQLIDRNDELCILCEKSNIQENTLKRGEVEMRARESELRMLRLRAAELSRQLEVLRKQQPLMPQFAKTILKLKSELAAEREVTENLCRNLETPQNPDRWRELRGEDPDMEQLNAKVQVLEERLNDKKEQLLEKELVLEEVTALSSKLRKQAAGGRSDTLALAKRVNDFQSRIKDTTRKMMATVSELSMYQATAMKLQQEKHDREAELEDAVWRLEHGEPPTEEAEHEWYRLERDRLRRQEEALHVQQQRAAQAPRGLPSQVTRTTAAPRPNAYIPNSGIPKPYGAQAPFKPSITGTTRRHIRAPQPKPIEM